MAKGKERLDAHPLVIAVADEDAFAVADFVPVAGEVEISGRVLQTNGKRLGEFPRRIHFAHQDVSDGAA